MRCRLPFLISALALTVTQATAGVVATATETSLDTKQTHTGMIYVDNDRLKIVSADNVMIFRGDLNRLWVIDPERHSYTELTAATMQQMAGAMAGAKAQMSAAQAQMQAEIAKLPPEQRAQLEAMLAGRGLGGALGQPPRAPQINYVKAGGSKSVANWRCDLYAKNVDGRKESDLCVVPISAAGLSVADFQVFERLATFMAPVMASPMMPKNDLANWTAMNKAIGFDGVPVDTVSYADGKADREMTISKLERTTVPAGTYDLPAGLTKRDLPGIGGPSPR